MRYDRYKAWPYPVLRSALPNGDYPHHAFEVDSSLEIETSSGAVAITAEFLLGHRGMESMVVDGNAVYVLLVKAPATHYRREFRSQSPEIECRFPSGELGGRVELTGYIVTTSDIPAFSLEGWNSEYRSATYTLESAAVLAIDEPWSEWLDYAGGLQSIFQLHPRPDMRGGEWRCNLRSERVLLEMSEELAREFEEAREHVERDPGVLAGIMNGVYLPALIHVLESADRDVVEENERGHAEWRWFDALNAILALHGLPEFGEGGSREADAQVLLREPFTPLLTSLKGA